MKLLAAVLLLAVAAPAQAQYPEAVVAAFCDADGRGVRLQSAPGAGELAGLVTWELEPAWDRLFLITGYELNPVRADDEEIEVEVRYTVAAEVSGEGVRNDSRIDAVRLRLARAGRSWRLVGPPPVPRLYASSFDADALFDQLMPIHGEYVSSSKFVWRMYQAAGWSVPYQTAADFLRAGYFRAVPEPAVGDVVAYLDGGAPYHLGIYEGEDRVASATVGGVLRTSLNAFPGEVRYLRLTRAGLATPTPGAEEGGPGEEGAAAAADQGVEAVAPAGPDVPPRQEPPASLEEAAAAAGEQQTPVAERGGPESPPLEAEPAGEAIEARPEGEPLPDAAGIEADIANLAATEAELGQRLRRALRTSGRVVSETGVPVRIDTPEQVSIEVLRREIEAVRSRRQQLESALESVRGPGADPPETRESPPQDELLPSDEAE